MTNRLLSGLVLAGLAAAAVGTQGAEALRAAEAPPPANRLVIQPESRLWVEGTSTVRSFKCTAKVVDGAVTLADPAARLTPAELGGAVANVTLEVPVANLDCGNGTMHDHMRKALKADKNPAIRFRSTSHEVVPTGDGEARVQVTGTLSIAGSEQVVTLDATATPDASGGLRVTGTEELRMTAYGVKPPKLMLGTLKVHDPVKVHFDLVLKQ